MIRIDTIWLATEPMDMRAGTDTAMARVISVFGTAQPHCAYLFANRRAIWSCSSLYDAYALYHWPHPALSRQARPKGASFAHNATTLSKLFSDLQKALYPTPNDRAVRIAAVDVMS